jgi:AcrR family transcriptional regulator
MDMQQFEKGNKERTRRRILEVASQHLRSKGIAASGLAGIMTDAGLTNGAFYAHFQSKDVLVRETLVEALADRRDAMSREQALEAAIRDYLNLDHVNDCANGCPSAALLPEIARQPAPARQAYEDGLQSYISEFARLLSGDKKKAHATALTMFALMVGTLQIARAVVDRGLAAETIESGVRTALALAIEHAGAE